MSVPTNVKASIKLANFEDNYIQGVYDEEHIVYLGANSSGTTVLVRRRWDLNGKKLSKGRYLNQTLLISDLTSSVVAAFSATMKIERMGTVSIAFASGALVGGIAIALTPSLPDATLANYIVLPGLQVVAFGIPYGIIANLNSTSSLQITVTRNFFQRTQSATTGATVNGSDLLDVSGMATDPVAEVVSGAHGSSASGFDHGHGTNVLHSLTDPGHTHLNTAPTAETVTGIWAIFHV
jgi:hypothetical protein